MTRKIFNITMMRSKRCITKKYGKDFWNKFRELSRSKLVDILPKVPEIGDSIFLLNYQFGPAYIAWYKTFLELGLSQEEIIANIWIMNEKMLTIIPKPLLHATGKSYLNSFRKKAARHVERQNRNECHPYDWYVVYHGIDKNSFEIEIKKCGLKMLARDFDADGLLPGICRMDYQVSWLMGNGFVRDKTIGDGDECCNCHYDLSGKCEWAPEKGFINRK